MTIRLRRRWPLCLGAALALACLVTGLPGRQVGADSDSFFVDTSSGGSPCPIAHCNQYLDGSERLTIPVSSPPTTYFTYTPPPPPGGLRPALPPRVAHVVGRAAAVPGPVAPGVVSATSGMTWTQQAELTSTAQTAYDAYGSAVAASEGTVVVGAESTPQFQAYGAAYIFVRSGGVWTQQAALADPGGVQDDLFGSAVAIDGDVAVIGAIREAGAVADSGAAFVYVRSGGVWTQQAKLIAPDGAAGDNFGFSVAISGTTIVVGAEGHNRGQGAAYVYVRSGGTWTQQAELRYPGPPVSISEFGWAVALSGDTAVISAVQTPLVFVYVRQGTTWAVQGVLHARHQAGLYFGIAVAVSGDTAFVGACCDYLGRLPGVAFVFARSGGVWSAQATLRPAGEQPGSTFGGTMALSGQTAVVGGDGAYVFVDHGGVWSEQAQLIPSDVGAYAIGGVVAISGNTAVAGRPAGVTSNFGAAYVFVRRSASDTADPATASAAGLARRDG